MYPRDFFDTYWRPELRNEIFVAMPFHDEFIDIWTTAIKPAIEEDVVGSYKANRVDTTMLSGCIIVDILDGIAHSRVVLADISICNTGAWKNQRNGNVMYEVGIAHALRQVEEVVIIRNDDEQISFDVSGIILNKYNRDNLISARNSISVFVSEALKLIDTSKSLKIQRAIGQLNNDMYFWLITWGKNEGFFGPAPKTMGEEVISISKKLALGRLQAEGILDSTPTSTPNGPAYSWTNFGKALLKVLGIR